MTSQEQQFTFRETTDEFTHCLWVKPNGFWSEAVRVNIEKTTGGDWKVYMTTSSIKHQHYYLPLSGQKLFHQNLTKRWHHEQPRT